MPISSRAKGTQGRKDLATDWKSRLPVTTPISSRCGQPGGDPDRPQAARRPVPADAPFIEMVGRVQVPHIVGGLANGGAAGFTPVDSPFGGLVLISGHIANPPDISSGAVPLRYKVSVSNDGGATWQALTNTFTVGRTQLLNGLWSFLPDATQADVAAAITSIAKI